MDDSRENARRSALIAVLSAMVALSAVGLWLATADSGGPREPVARDALIGDSGPSDVPGLTGSTPRASQPAEPTPAAQIDVVRLSTTPLLPRPATDALLSRATDMSVFFGHQSVGGNVLTGVSEVYQDSPYSLDIVETERPEGRPGVLAHAYIGENGDPLAKIQDFARIIRGGAGDVVDVAFMKFCYVDVTEGTDISDVFDTYQQTMSELEREYGDVRFLHVTVPLTCADPHPEDNVAREAFNTLIRDEYGDTGRVYDLAAIEATSPDGALVHGDVAGSPYAALFEGYTHDCGHLNEQGRVVAALGLLGSLV
ncbi:MAG: hypothetical protein MUD05_03770 [Candidatus Nanopelagicales bacterium]|nr:hypothetical protein [Candidatus Nanopelagicales bacterium]